MADEEKNIKVISKKNSGFPEYLDFNKLRSDSISYLGELSGKIWTDHNVHDPGITILEVLIYALMDLGYRTSLPAAEIFAKDPEEKTPDNNFYTPAQILACNPLTIADYRKLLIDIEGVKNAWLVVADDVNHERVCNDDEQDKGDDVTAGTAASPAENTGNNNSCIKYLNGLYDVYLELENKYPADVIVKVKAALMAHRNLCEDFIDKIKVLEKIETGVCADIELKTNADAGKVYIKLAENLRDFFSPSPKFYTLQQLLDKNKSIEEIFAGRPYDTAKSHGFVDTEEFGAIELKKEIHLSDVYNVILKTEGVETVRHLMLRKCCEGKPAENFGAWELSLPENHIPEFSISCSRFNFFKNDSIVSVDVKKYAPYFKLNFTSNSKVFHTQPSPYLDAEIKYGPYHKDLDGYLSVQNDFPQVYGIGEGQLPADVSEERKSQALQLKGYLLFFDQLLANYLTQLKNIRNLFAFSIPDEADRHTYFINKLGSVPELNKLLRFKTDDSNGGFHGSEGSIIAFPADKGMLKAIEAKLRNGEILECGFDKDLKGYTFATATDCDIAVAQLMDDLKYGNYKPVIISNKKGCFYFYVLTSSECTGIFSKKIYPDQKAANEAAASFMYLATVEENYRSYIVSGTARFSFDIEFNLAGYLPNLQAIIENKDQFYSRRNIFLDHLLSRFAERFTDFTLLTYGFLNERELNAADINRKESFLAHYAEISSNRGKAYDYTVNGWNNDNISGFEKRFKALAGIEDWRKRSLCNFEVAKYASQYTVDLTVAGQKYFSVTQKFDSYKEATGTAALLFQALKDHGRFKVDPVAHENKYVLKVFYGEKSEAIFPGKYKEEDALDIRDNIHRMFSGKPAGTDIHTSSYIYRLQLQDHEGNIIRTSNDHWGSTAEAEAALLKADKKINRTEKWGFPENIWQPVQLHAGKNKTQARNFIDKTFFKVDINNTIVGQPDLFTYDVLDTGNNFKFHSTHQFQEAKQAEAHSLDFLSLLADDGFYDVRKNPETGRWAILIVEGDSVEAVCSSEYNTPHTAGEMKKNIQRIVAPHQYFLSVTSQPNRWKFDYTLGYKKGQQYIFESEDDFTSYENAKSTAVLFFDHVLNLELDETNNAFLLVPHNVQSLHTTCKFHAEDIGGSKQKLKEKLRGLLAEQKEIKTLAENPHHKNFGKSVSVDKLSLQQGNWVYRLVDKDNIPAYYTEGYTSKTEAESKIQSIAQKFKNDVPYLGIITIGRSVINERKDSKTKSTWYHYQVICISGGPLPGKEMILFESTTGYKSNEDAENAFKENYLKIISLAMLDENYGSAISFEKDLQKVLIHTDDLCIKNEMIVFIPEATQQYLGGNAGDITRQLIKTAESYPIRMVQFRSEEFYGLFPCEKKEPVISNCKKEEKFVYYFILPSLPPGFGGWQSIKFYESAEDAGKQFHFFLLLLKYQGNYYIDCGPCTENDNVYRVFLREVLAESAERFGANDNSDKDAWKFGVQKFICTAQSQGAFHNYYRNKDCCYSFYVACENSLIYHPCQYDTAQKRDTVLSGLYEALVTAANNKSYQTDWDENFLILLNKEGKPFAKTSTHEQIDICFSSVVIDLENVFRLNNNYYRDDAGYIHFGEKNKEPLVSSVHAYHSEKPGDDIKQWKALLASFFSYYPIIRKEKNENSSSNEGTEYCIEIKLPGFNVYNDYAGLEEPCNCNNQDLPVCSVAWKVRCCFSSCKDAEEGLKKITKTLLSLHYYRPVYDCICGSYGIALQYSKIEMTDDEQFNYFFEEADLRDWDQGEIVAFNPQCYPTPDMACAAVERAKKLINAEGLDIVEHILLRPKNPEGNKCTELNECCNLTNCEWEWNNPETGICSQKLPACFIPGNDPYSFIATIALPAWPARFQKTENRKQIETMLYREAPAHVLLRILWLSPHDFCCFEEMFKNWNRFVANKRICNDDFDPCSFLHFLFSRQIECLNECSTCLPCILEEPQPADCAEDNDMKEQPVSFVKQVNTFFCFQQEDCINDYIECKPAEDIQEGDNTSIGLSHEPLLRRRNGDNNPAYYEDPLPEENDVDGAGQPSPAEDNFHQAPVHDERARINFVNSRLGKYKMAIDKIISETNDNVSAGLAGAFVKDHAPAPRRLAEFVESLLQNTGAENTDGLSAQQQRLLLQNTICYYLDKVCFNGKNSDRINALEPVVQRLKEYNRDTGDIYNYWDAQEVKNYEPGIDENGIRKIFAGG